jgi:hypothetical protein
MDKPELKSAFLEVFAAADPDLRTAIRENLHDIRTDVQKERDETTDQSDKDGLTKLDELFETAIDALDDADTELEDGDDKGSEDDDLGED